MLFMYDLWHSVCHSPLTMCRFWQVCELKLTEYTLKWKQATFNHLTIQPSMEPSFYHFVTFILIYANKCDLSRGIQKDRNCNVLCIQKPKSKRYENIAFQKYYFESATPDDIHRIVISGWMHANVCDFRVFQTIHIILTNFSRFLTQFRFSLVCTQVPAYAQCS